MSFSFGYVGIQLVEGDEWKSVIIIGLIDVFKNFRPKELTDVDGSCQHICNIHLTILIYYFYVHTSIHTFFNVLQTYVNRARV